MRILLRLLVAPALVALAFGAAGATAASPAPRPNVVLMLADDLGYGDLGCYGHPRIRTPRLDALAAEGIRFTAFYAAAPVCSPSRAGILTGRVPDRAGIHDWIRPGSSVHLRAGEPSLARFLRDAGYATGFFGKWHLSGRLDGSQPTPAEHGFETWFATQNNAAPSHANPNNFLRDGEPVGEIRGHSAGIVADEAIGWMERARRDRPDAPFLLFAWFHEPHEPVASAPERLAEYADVEPEIADSGKRQYYANVSQLDEAVGRIADAADRIGGRENTLILFTSDNGPETLNRYKGSHRSHGSAGPLRGMKLHLHEGGIRVPGIARMPGRIPAGRVEDRPVGAVDLLPTICELARIAPPSDADFDGTSLVGLFDGGDFARPRPLYWQYYRAFGGTKAAMRDGDWKILGIWNGPELLPGASLQAGDQRILRESEIVGFELHDLSADPSEREDSAARESDRAEAMGARLRERWREIRREAPEWADP